MPPLQLSVVIPTYKEKENILILVPELSQVLTGISHEIIVVDDHSPDGTGEAVQALAGAGHSVRLIDKEKKEGIGAALRVGYAAAQGQWIASMDADLSFETKDLVRMMEKIKEGADLVTGNRHCQTDLYEARKFSTQVKHGVSLAGNKVLKFSTGIPLGDYSANFRMIKHEVWHKIQTQENTNTLLFEMILKCWIGGFVIEEIPVIFRDRRLGQSKLKLSIEAPKFLWKLLSYLFRYRKELVKKRWCKNCSAKKISVWAVAIGAIVMAAFFQTQASTEELSGSKRHTDIQIESVSGNPLARYNRQKEKNTMDLLPLSESTSVGINENGDPSVGTRF